MADSYLSVKQIASQLSIDVGKVLAWIHTGQLGAIDVSERPGGRPRWRIPLAAWLDFQHARSNRSIIPPAPAKKRRRADSSVIEFY